MTFRYRKSINLGGGLRLNVNKNGVSVSAGRKGVRYTASSTGRRTTTVGIPGTGVRWQSVGTNTTDRPHAIPASASGPRRVPASAARPGWLAPRAEKRLFAALQRALSYPDADGWADEMVGVAATTPELRLAAHALAGVLLGGRDPQLVVSFLTQVLNSGAEPASDRFLATYCADLTDRVTVAPDLYQELPLGRDLACVHLALAYQQLGCREQALSVSRQLSHLPWGKMFCFYRLDQQP